MRAMARALGSGVLRFGALGSCLLAVGVLTGCAGLPFGSDIASFCPEQEMILTSEPDGRACLEGLEQEADIAAWVAERGEPDYIERPSGSQIRFFYIGFDQVVTFGRGLFAGEPRVMARIRAADHTRFTDADRARLGSTRMGDVAAPAQDDSSTTSSGGVVRARVGQDR